MKKYLFALLVAYAISLFGQDLGKIELDLLQHLRKITNLANHDAASASDSLEKENEILSQKLVSYTAKYPATLGYDFKDLQKEGLTIATSSDKKFRIYSWDSWTGGTMHFFSNVFQFQANNTVYSKSFAYKNKEDDFNPGGWYSEIFTLNTESRRIYLGYFNTVYSTRDIYQAVKTFEIMGNGKMQEAKLIKTKTGLHNELGFKFDFFSVVDRKERPIKLIRFDSASKTIQIPVVNELGAVTNKSILYQFSGQYFEQKKD